MYKSDVEEFVPIIIRGFPYLYTQPPHKDQQCFQLHPCKDLKVPTYFPYILEDYVSGPCVYFLTSGFHGYVGLTIGS